MLCALLILLHFGMLAYHTYKVVVEQCLPTASSGVPVAMDVLENKHVVRVNTTHIILMLYYNIVVFIGSCCKLFVDMIIS